MHSSNCRRAWRRTRSCKSALRRAVRVYGLSRYRVDAPRAGEADLPPALVLGFGNVNEERILRGVEILGAVLSSTSA